MSHPRISVFPKCYFDELVRGERSYVGWIHDAATLGGEGVEHYDEFFPSYDERDVAPGDGRDARDGADLVDALLLARTSRTQTLTSGAARWSGRRRPSTSACASAPGIAGH